MKYVGEHLLVGQIGYFLVLLSFVSAIVSAIAFAKSTSAADIAQAESWKKLGRISFSIQAFTVLAIFFVLYLIIYNHYFEYKYAHQHSKRSLEMKYLLSCFWEGQEGSFMLWSFWHAVLGLIIMRKADKWEAPVLSVISVAQVFLASFIIGIYLFDIRLGSGPFVLMRNEFPDAPVFKDPEYLQKYLTDGNGLNVLLQNYWMVIHPPILFLGFASTIVPFGYAVAGLWRKEYGEWTKPALPWALFGAGVLGLGIMMGAAWAYESLTFGGYWAWDPVENASLVPWLVLVAGIHTVLIYRSTGHSLKASYWFMMLSFLLVLYSTFLTRTGVLGDTSVHSFTGEGDTLFWHLLAMMFVFTAWPTVMYMRNMKAIPVVRQEEKMTSREFWMFVGALLLMISSAYITFWTSLPIFNKIFGTKAAIGEDVEYVYNRVIVLVVVVIGVLTAITQYFKYKDTPKDYMRKKLLWPTVAALVIALAVSFGYGLDYDKYGFGFLGALYVALFAGIYAVIANAAYIWSVLKGNWKAAGASISHVGFGLMIVGILISASNKEVISINRTGIYIPGLKDVKGKEEDARQNATLIQGIPTDMGRYTVTYLGDSTAAGDEKTYFKVHYERKDKVSGKVLEEFRLYPDAFVMKGGEGTNISANPDSKHYWDHDVFTYITSMPNPDAIKDTSTFRSHVVSSGDTVFYSNGYILVKDVVVANKKDNPELPVVDSAWLTSLRVYGKNGQEFDAQPAYFKKDGIPGSQPDTVMPQSLILQINSVAGNRVELGVRESETVMRFVTLKAYAFPMINVLWLGTIIMFIGFMISALHRARRRVS